MRVSRALGVAARPPKVESPRRHDRPESIELQSAGDAKGKGFSENGAAGLLRCSADHEARNSGHSTVFGAGLLAKPRALGLEWIRSDFPIARGARRRELRNQAEGFTNEYKFYFIFFSLVSLAQCT